VVSVLDVRRMSEGLLAMLFTAGLLWFGTGLQPFWPLLWLAPLPVLWFASRSAWCVSALVATSAWFLGSLNMWHYFYGVLGMPCFLVVSILLLFALVFTSALLHFRALLKRGMYWSAVLAFPAVWVSFEYLLNLVSPHGTTGSLAYSQLNFLPFLQLASLTGPWGLSFLVMLLPASLAAGIHLGRWAMKQALGIVGTVIAVLGLVLLFGAARLAAPAPDSTVKVGLMASDQPGQVDVAQAGESTARLLVAYATQASALSARGAQVIVLPEKLGVMADSGSTDALFQSVADRYKVEVVVGLVSASPLRKLNQARVYAPGVPVRTYDKQHLLPVFESGFQAGMDLTLLSRPSGIWGVAICKDMDFMTPSRHYGQAGAGLLLVPAWDFVVDRFEHGHKAVMRGVEGGFSVVRAAKQGYLTASDDRGRILGETTTDPASFVSLIVAVPVMHHNTLYQCWGDWFAWIAIALVAFTLGQLYRSNQRPE